jgi:SM-20-related protein
MKVSGPDQLYEEIISGLSENNYALAEGLFGEAVLAGLHAELHRQINLRNLKNAATGNRVNTVNNQSIRSDKIKWIDNHPKNESEQAFIQKINDLSAYLNRTCYTGIRDCEFHYACFEKGSFYKRHIDQFKNDESRKFSVVTYLNKNCILTLRLKQSLLNRSRTGPSCSEATKLITKDRASMDK